MGSRERDRVSVNQTAVKQHTNVKPRKEPLIWAVTLLATFVAAGAPAQNQKPNIVFILADNVGYGDLGPDGGGELRGAPTPRI